MMSRHAALGSVCVAAAILLIGCTQDRSTGPSPTDLGGPSFAAAPAEGEKVPGQYIVRLRDDVRDVPTLAAQIAILNGGRLDRIYTRAIKGFSVKISDAAAAALARHPLVQYVEQDAWAKLFAEQANPPSWGTDRVDQADLPLDQFYRYNADGTGTNVYVFDTGVRPTHQDFAGRVQFVPAGVNGDFVGDGHGSAADCHGHGTHVAGSAAGATYGLAKNATIWAARVVNCSGGGQASMLIAALDWCVTGCVRPAVVNMSLGYGNVQSVRDAARRVAEAGVSTTAAAGNGFYGFPLDACGEAPAGEPTANTVGSTQRDDKESSFSNFGSCVDILAPGSSITSAWHTSDNATNTISGTSMATPHVAGAIALYLQANPNASPAEVSAALVQNSIPNTIVLHSSSVNGGTPNRFLNTAWIAAGPPPPPPPPPDGAPSNLTAAAVSKSQVNLAWADNSTNESGFKIERCQGAGCTNFAQIATTAANTFSNTSLSPNTTYSYRVRAYNGGGDSDYSNIAQATTFANQAPIARDTWACTAKGGRSCTFNGTSSTDPDGSISTYRWNFGDGTTASGAQVSHRYSSGGTYIVTLTVTDNNGETGSCSKAVQTGTSGSCP